MARRGATRGAPHRLLRGRHGAAAVATSLWLSSAAAGCVYDWSLPDAATGGTDPSGSTGGSGGSSPSASSSGGMGGAGGAAGVGGEAGSGGLGGMGGAPCSEQVSCEACKSCVYDQLPGTQQDCAVYDACAYACGADPSCQSDCMTTFPEGYDIQIELIASCDALCAQVPTCI